VAPEAATAELHEAIRSRRLSPAAARPTDTAPLAAAAPIPASPRPDLHHRLPAQPTRLIGRDREQALIGARLLEEGTRLLTLTGPGGVGKTRLALQVAASLADHFEGDVLFVALAPVLDPALVGSAIAQALGVGEAAGRPLVESVKDRLRDAELLLLLDNFEHLLAAAPLVADLLATCPRLKILITSRAVLHLRGEKEFAVPPLALPDRDQLLSLQTLAGSAAVALLVERACDARPDFAITSENALAVAEICRRLDGLPLAIELAAARVKLLPPGALLARLEHRLALLTGGPRDLPARQQTLRDTIAWSHDLLDDPERALYRRLGVFASGFDLEVAEAVCASDEVLDGLASLVDKSLVYREEGPDGNVRFQMLETIREFATEQLKALGELDATRRRHAEHFLALAERAAPELSGPTQSAWFDVLEREHDNLRAALQWSIEHRDAELALRLSGALRLFWIVRGHRGEGRRWCEQALALDPELGGTLRPMVLSVAGHLARLQNDYTRATALYQEALAVRREAGDTYEIASSLHDIAELAWDLGDYARAVPLLDEALAIRREIEDRGGMAITLRLLGRVAYEQGNDAAARAAAEENLALFRALGDEHAVGHALDFLGVLARGQGDQQQATKLHQEGLAIFERIADKDGLAQAWLNLGRLALERGDWARATALCVESLAALHALGAPGDLPPHLDTLAGAALAAGQPERASCLLGSAQALRDATGVPLRPSERAEYAATVAAARARLGDPAFNAAHATGRAMSLEQVVTHARATQPNIPPPG